MVSVVKVELIDRVDLINETLSYLPFLLLILGSEGLRESLGEGVRHLLMIEVRLHGVVPDGLIVHLVQLGQVIEIMDLVG